MKLIFDKSKSWETSSCQEGEYIKIGAKTGICSPETITALAHELAHLKLEHSKYVTFYNPNEDFVLLLEAQADQFCLDNIAKDALAPETLLWGLASYALGCSKLVPTLVEYGQRITLRRKHA